MGMALIYSIKLLFELRAKWTLNWKFSLMSQQSYKAFLFVFQKRQKTASSYSELWCSLTHQMVQILNHQTTSVALDKLGKAEKFLEKQGSYFCGTPFRWVLAAESRHWFKRMPKGVMLCVFVHTRVHVCVCNSESSCVTLQNTVTCRDFFTLKFVCTCNTLCVCEHHLCVHTGCGDQKCSCCQNQNKSLNKREAGWTETGNPKTRGHGLKCFLQCQAGLRPCWDRRGGTGMLAIQALNSQLSHHRIHLI